MQSSRGIILLELKVIRRIGKFGGNDILNPSMTSDNTLSQEVSGVLEILSRMWLVKGYFIEISSVFIEALATLLTK